MKPFDLILLCIAASIVVLALDVKAESCFLDGANQVRCGNAVNGSAYQGVAWPVFTAETPEEVQREAVMQYGYVNPPYLDADQDFTTKHVRIDAPENYPDVTCLDFYQRGKKQSQICFNTMEITER